MSNKLSLKNHVVRSHGFYGTWGRGLTIQEALKNADLELTDSFDYFHFKNDNWDILDTGNVTYNRDILIHHETFKK